MLRCLTCLAALLPTIAVAAELPISGNYGSPLGCLFHAKGGNEAVYTAGATLVGKLSDVEIAGDGEDPIFLVTPSEILAHEWSCLPKKVAGDAVSLSCEEAGDEGGSLVKASFREDRAAGTLTYTDERGTMTLRRCP